MTWCAKKSLVGCTTNPDLNSLSDELRGDAPPSRLWQGSQGEQVDGLVVSRVVLEGLGHPDGLPGGADGQRVRARVGGQQLLQALALLLAYVLTGSVETSRATLTPRIWPVELDRRVDQQDSRTVASTGEGGNLLAEQLADLLVGLLADLQVGRGRVLREV